MTKTPLYLLFGVVLGVGTVIACGDDSPGDADAAACDCPAAEPPLAERIVRSPLGSGTVTIPAGEFGAQSNSCPDGSTLLTGSCFQDTNPNGLAVYLLNAGFRAGADPTTWSCYWHNTSAQAVEVRVDVVCLMPAE